MAGVNAPGLLLRSCTLQMVVGMLLLLLCPRSTNGGGGGRGGGTPDKPLLHGCVVPKARVLERVVAKGRVDGLFQEQCCGEELAERRRVKVEVYRVERKEEKRDIRILRLPDTYTEKRAVDRSNTNTLTHVYANQLRPCTHMRENLMGRGQGGRLRTALERKWLLHREPRYENHATEDKLSMRKHTSFGNVCWLPAGTQVEHTLPWFGC